MHPGGKDRASRLLHTEVMMESVSIARANAGLPSVTPVNPLPEICMTLLSYGLAQRCKPVNLTNVLLRSPTDELQ